MRLFADTKKQTQMNKNQIYWWIQKKKKEEMQNILQLYLDDNADESLHKYKKSLKPQKKHHTTLSLNQFISLSIRRCCGGRTRETITQKYFKLKNY